MDYSDSYEIFVFGGFGPIDHISATGLRPLDLGNESDRALLAAALLTEA